MKASVLSCKWNLGKIEPKLSNLPTQLPKSHIISLKDLTDSEGGMCLH